MAQLSTRERLKKFHETVIELKRTSLMQKGLGLKMNIRVEGLETLFEKEEWPEEDDLRSFLLTFRNFVAEKEDVFLNRIFNLCYQKLTDGELRKDLVKAHKTWKEANDTAGINIVYKGKRQTPEQTTKLFLSGKYFHKDEEKKAILKELQPAQIMFFELQFLSYMLEATRIIFYVDGIVVTALKEGLYRD